MPLHHLALAIALALTTCIAPHERPSAAHLVGSSVDPPAVAPDRTARLPTLTLAFDQPLAPPGDDAVWLLAGEITSALRTAATRGGLGATDSARRLDAEVWLEPDDPTVLRVRPREPLLPDTLFVVATSVRLTTAEGAPVFGPADAPEYAPVIQQYQVAPAPACPPLARLAFPLGDNVPTHAAHVVIAFDRPVLEPTDGSPLALVRSDSDGSELGSTATLGCRVPGLLGGTCVTLTLGDPLAPDASYTVALGALVDDAGLAPQAVSLTLHTAPAAPDDPSSSPPPPDAAPAVCASDELARAPFCVRILARGAIEVRGVTTAPGALRVLAGLHAAESVAGTDHVARAEGVLSHALVPLRVWTVALDGTAGAARVLDPVQTPPASPRFRITEVLAHPASSSAQEFVELVNDGPSAATLAGLVLATSSGRSVLPDVSVPPGARALAVGPQFDPRGAPRAGDPAVAPGTILARTSASLAGRGLADRGVDVWLADADGHVISRAPLGSGAHPPRTGVSLVRADVRMKEDDPAAWSYDAQGGSTPGLPDRVR